MKNVEHKCLISKFEVKEGNDLTANDLIRINPNKPEFGSMMLITPTPVRLSNGFTNSGSKVGFITGRVDELSKLIKDYEIEAGDDFCKLAGPHVIRTVEIVKSEFIGSYKSREDHTTPEESGFRVKINPTTEQELCNKDGEIIYWKTEVVPGTPETVIDKKVEFVSAAVPADSGIEDFSGAGKKADEKAKVK